MAYADGCMLRFIEEGVEVYEEKQQQCPNSGPNQTTDRVHTSGAVDAMRTADARTAFGFRIIADIPLLVGIRGLTILIIAWQQR